MGRCESGIDPLIISPSESEKAYFSKCQTIDNVNNFRIKVCLVVSLLAQSSFRHLPLQLNKSHISLIYHLSRDILSHLHRKQKPISCCVNFLCLRGHRFPLCSFPNCACMHVCVCVCLQIVTTLMAAPAREHQMSLHLSSAISRLVHLSLRPCIAPPLHDPPFSASRATLSKLTHMSRWKGWETTERGGGMWKRQREKKKKEKRKLGKVWIKRVKRHRGEARLRVREEKGEIEEEVKGRIREEMERETTKAFYTHI